MTKYRKRGNRERMSQDFDKEKITFKRAGKEINVYDFIQAGREDTEIIPTLEKYGSIEVMKLHPENAQAMYQDLTEIQQLGGYREILDYQKKAKEMFYNLPSDVRKDFDNDHKKFAEKGREYLNEKITKWQKENETQAQAQAQTKEMKGGNNE